MRNNITSTIKTLFLLALCSALGYHIYLTVQKMTPCSRPLPYALGDFDNRFGISQEYFLSALTDAEAVWEVPYGKNLFEYEPTYKKSDLLKINLIYDYRQEATSKLQSLGGAVNNDKAQYDAMQARFQSMKANYTAEQNALNARITAFNTKSTAYEAQVDYWNKKGGAPQKEYNTLQAEQVSLNQEVQEIKEEQANLQSKVADINTLVAQLNSLADKLNITVRDYNNTSSARGESFEEGLYSSDGKNSKIDIYEFSDRQKLVRVLAHELGHALGLEHVADPTSIMYAFNKGSSLKLSADDLAALKNLCEAKK